MTRNKSFLIFIILIALMFAILVAGGCGSGNPGVSGENHDNIAGGGQSGTGVAITGVTVGSISKIGSTNERSINVNGIHFYCSLSKIYVDENFVGIGDEGFLKIYPSDRSCG